MPQEGFQIISKASELEIIATKAQTDGDTIPDDGSEFPNYTPMKSLKQSFLTLADIAHTLSEQLTEIRKTGNIA
jgi:negative regulator of genetic competence, sporulation and motility